MNILMKTLKSLLQKGINDIDEGSCNMNDAELASAVSSLQQFSRKDIPMSKYQAYNYLGISRATFDNYVKEGKIPKGQKVLGFKELSWKRVDLDKFIKECRLKK